MESHSHRWPPRFNGPVTDILGCRFCARRHGGAGGERR
ncbi:hypothetical protein DIQ79_06775 [Mycolicibacterium smegmatis]|uniref:Uncharacterized protein n=1 Tax=Mycolicibacterium smegmatis (strain ATCC 700084 / mc(2)155) TaxID=246196 RepID=A0QYU9_MYCS2|nr:hypothetical protein MSMEG_3794 [Mycolicibacterium smegmatis MC2 155]TBM51908.1 hypothetical protein DIQ86_03725 [Mycolicibacterium smegmatis]TBH50478.1 hypothetical protein EYS45_05955 [Mycolicibacterium smegmatis MC2 155]TBM53850.1 hypothetical protein DIQ85_07420 [Mycolicibacterium smegmatis]TBM65276.1 hypothetical protein DIQ83_06775 [Mycolicibacterium smegmatis]